MNALKSVYWRIRSQAWASLKYPVALMARPLGYRLLTKKQTIAYLEPYRVVTHAESVCPLPPVSDVAESTKIIFHKNEVNTAPVHVWRYEAGTHPTTLLRCGLLLTGGRVLNTDYWNDDALGDLLKPNNRPHHHAQTLLAPFGHYFEGNKFVGYYDFIFLIAAKLCRLKEAAPDADYHDAVVSYPLVGTRYEQELLELLGFGPDRVFDSRLRAVYADITYLGNHDNWMHPNAADIRLLKKHLEPLIQSSQIGPERVYISRAGRRRNLNEPALIALLTGYGFTVIEDKPRSLAEQYTIYHNTSFIIGPHGASFTNLLWCQPGTQLLELFTARFVQSHFFYLAQVLGLSYQAYCQDDSPTVDYGAIADDINVSVPELARYLAKFFGEK